MITPETIKAIDRGIQSSAVLLTHEQRQDLTQDCLIEAHEKGFLDKPNSLRRLGRWRALTYKLHKGKVVADPWTIRDNDRVTRPDRDIMIDIDRLPDSRDRTICRMILEGYRLYEIAKTVNRDIARRRGHLLRIANKLELAT